MQSLIRKRFAVEAWSERDETFEMLRDGINSLAEARNYVLHEGKNGKSYRLVYADTSGDPVYLAVIQLQRTAKQAPIAELWPLYCAHEDVFK